MFYTSKYCAKVDDEDHSFPTEKVGRWWGIHNRKMLPLVQPVTLELSFAEHRKLIDAINEKLDLDYSSSTRFGTNPEEFVDQVIGEEMRRRLKREQMSWNGLQAEMDIELKEKPREYGT